MGYPELDHDEPVILESRNVKHNSIFFNAILTRKRIHLTATKTTVIPVKNILLSTIRDVETGENAIRDHFLILSLMTEAGQKHQEILTFARQAGVERKRECNEWAKKLKSLILTAAPVTIPSEEPEPERKPLTNPEVPAREPGNAPGTRPVKKKIPIVSAVRTVVEKTSGDPEQKVTVSISSGSICARCGNRIPMKSTFCSSCGTPVKRSERADLEPQPGASVAKVSVSPQVPAPVSRKEPEKVQPAVPAPVSRKEPEKVQSPVPASVSRKEPEKVQPAVPAPVSRKEPEKVQPAVPAPVSRKEPEKVQPAVPAPVSRKEPEKIQPVVPAPVSRKEPEKIQPAVPASVSRKEPEKVQSPVPASVSQKEPEKIQPAVPAPVSRKEPEKVQPAVPAPVSRKEPEKVQPAVPAPVSRKEPEKIQPAVPAPVSRKEPEKIQPAVPAPVSRKEPEKIQPAVPAPVSRKEPEKIQPAVPAPVSRKEPEKIQPAVPAPVSRKEPEKIQPAEPAPVSRKEPEKIQSPVPAPVVQKEPEKVQPAEPAPVVQKEPEKPQPAAGFPEENQENSVGQMTHSIEPLIGDSMFSSRQDPLGIHTPPTLQQNEPPSDLSQAGSGLQVVWPKFSPAEFTTAPAQNPVPAEHGPPPPIPHSAPGGKKSKNIAAGFLILAILPVLIGLILGAHLLSGPSSGAENSTLVIPPATTLQTQLPQTTGIPGGTITPEPESTDVSIPSTGVWVRVSYPGTFTGLIGTTGNQREVTDTGDRLYPIPAGARTVTVSLEKEDASGDQMLLEVYRDGVMLKRESSITPNGIVEMNLDLNSL